MIRCVVPGVTSAQAPLKHAHKSKGQVNQTRSWRQVEIKLEGKTGSRDGETNGMLIRPPIFVCAVSNVTNRTEDWMCKILR